MAIITLTSDYGTQDHYVASVKAAILSMKPDAVIVDITHDVPHHNLMHASFVVKCAYKMFPEGSIHVLDILSESSIEMPNKAIFYDGHYFVGTDNGIFALIFDKVPEKVYEIEVAQDSGYFTFIARDLIAKVAVHLALGKPVEALGKHRPGVNSMLMYQPLTDKDMIRGQVIHVDSYQNLFFNITESLFRETGKGREFSLKIRSHGYDIDRISTSYSDVNEGEILALFSSGSYLQIAINRGKAAGLLGMNIGDYVRIEFE